MVSLKSSFNREVFKIAFLNVFGYFVILLFVVISLIILGYFSRNNPLRELFLVQIPLTLLGGFLASYGASLVVTMREGLNIIEKYEGRPYFANVIKVELTPQNVKFDENKGKYEFGLQVKETRTGHIIRHNLDVLFDVYNLDVQIPPEKNEEDYFNFENATINIGNHELQIFYDNETYKIKNLTNYWKRLDITITKRKLKEIFGNDNDFSSGTPITTTVEGKSEKGYILKEDNQQSSILWLTLGYLVVVPTKIVHMVIKLENFEEVGIKFDESIANRRWRRKSNHLEPFSISRIRYNKNQKELVIMIGRTDPRLFIGEQLTLEIPLIKKYRE